MLLAPIAAVAVLWAAPAPAPATALAGDCSAPGSWAPDRADLANAVVKLVNAHRASLGLHPLAVSPALSRSAVWKARHMATYRYMAHEDPAPPVARSPGQRLAACGYSSSWGENIAEGFPTASSVVAAWLGSPGHRANIENPSYRVTGSGAAVANGGIVFWAQDFGTTADAGSAPPTGTGTATHAIVLRNLRLAPHRPHPGGTLSVHVGAVGAPSMKPLAHATVACHGTAGGRTLQVVSHGFADGVAACTWRVAGTALVTARVVVSSGGHAAVASFATQPS
ncbi:MAG TPA: CAP domain-containing protein [Gaiellaceae bacterium]